MGFNKRYVSGEQLISRYRDKGLLGVEEYLGKADVFISTDRLSENVVDVYNSMFSGSTIEKWDVITKLVSDESIKQQWDSDKLS